MSVNLSQVDLTSRHEAVLVAEAVTGASDLEHPDGALGELDEDYPVEDPQVDVKTSNYEEVENFYNTGRSEDIRIL